MWLGVLTIVIGVLTIVAIIVGPIQALRVQRRLDEEREIKGRKLGIFRTLMSFRATRLAPAFVQALNLIDIEFASPSEKPIRDAWKELQDHYSDMGRKTPKESEQDEKADNEKVSDLLTELLVKMGGALGYSYDRVYIKKGAYYPLGNYDVEQEGHALRKRLLALLAGNSRLPVAVFEEKFAPMTVTPEVPTVASEAKPQGPDR